MFVSSDRSTALESGDTIYGVIAGIGLSTTSTAGLPRALTSEGQLRAMRARLRTKPGWKPKT